MTVSPLSTAPKPTPDDDADPNAAPAFGDPLDPVHPSADMARFLLRRRSTTAKGLTAPGPGPKDLRHILQAGARVPDHGKLAPWRFVVFQGDARARAGAVLEQAWRAANPQGKDDVAAYERGRFLRAPVVVAVVSSLKPSPKIPEWEQVLSAGAVCQTMLITAQALGFAGQWLTEWYAYDASVTQAFGLGNGERIAGFLYFGTALEDPNERARPDLDDLITEWA